MKRIIFLLIVIGISYATSAQTRRARVIGSHHNSTYVMQDVNAKQYLDSLNAIRAAAGYSAIPYGPAIDTFFMDMKNSITDPRIALGYNLYAKFSGGNGFGALFDGGNFNGVGGSDPTPTVYDLKQCALLNCFDPANKFTLVAGTGTTNGTSLSDSGIIFNQAVYINSNFTFQAGQTTGFMALYEYRNNSSPNIDAGYIEGGGSRFALYGGYPGSQIYADIFTSTELAINYSSSIGLKEMTTDGTTNTFVFNNGAAPTVVTGTRAGTVTTPLSFFIGNVNNNGTPAASAFQRGISACFVSRQGLSTAERQCFERCLLAYKERRGVQVVLPLNPF